MCPKVNASLLYAISAYKKFHRNASLSGSRGNLYPTFQISQFMVFHFLQTTYQKVKDDFTLFLFSLLCYEIKLSSEVVILQISKFKCLQGSDT